MITAPTSPPPSGHGKRVLGTMTIMLGTGVGLETSFYGWGVALVALGAFLVLTGTLEGWIRRKRHQACPENHNA